MVVAARGGALLRVDGAVLRGTPELLGRTLDALGQEVSEPLAMADHLGEPRGALDVAPRESEPELRLGDVAFLLTLHHPAADPAELVDVEARTVELGVQPGHALDVAHGADRPAGARPALVLRLVDDRALALALSDDGHVAVVHAAGAALVA